MQQSMHNQLLSATWFITAKYFYLIISKCQNIKIVLKANIYSIAYAPVAQLG